MSLKREIELQGNQYIMLWEYLCMFNNYNDISHKQL